MPQTTYTAYDTTGQTKMTDMDQVAEQRRREMQDQAFRGALLNNQNNMQREGWGRQDALTQAGLTAQERIAAANNANQLAMGGSFQDRTAANQAQLAAQMRPAQTMADLEANKWKEGSGLRESGNALTQEINTAKLNAIRGGMSGAGGGNSRLAAALMGINPDQLEDPQDRMVRAAVLQGLSQRLASGEIDPQQFQAAAKGDYSSLPVKQASSITTDQTLQALDSSVDRFGSKDAATIGLDPGDKDIADLIAERDQAAKAIRMQNPRITPEQATQDANFRIEQRLKPYADRWGTGWIAKLREVMRGGAGGNVSEMGGSEGIEMATGLLNPMGAATSAYRLLNATR
jgi:hypothetical protein